MEKGLGSFYMEQSFQYKWEELDQVTPSAIHLEKNSTLVFWIFLFLGVLFAVFFAGYRWTSLPNRFEPASSSYSFSMETFLVRISSSEQGTVLTRIKPLIFADNIRVQNELLENQSQYKEHLIFFLSQTQTDDFFDKKRKQALEEKIKNHINAFLSSGRIHQILIKEQFI